MHDHVILGEPEHCLKGLAIIVFPTLDFSARLLLLCERRWDLDREANKWDQDILPNK